MKSAITPFLVFIFISNSLWAQSHIIWDTLQPPEDYENVAVKLIYTDNEVSTFVIWVKKEVPLHIHANHTEQVFILKGKGLFTLGDETFIVKKGDILLIPKGIPHAVKILSKKPMKVISVQAPEFTGKDRIIIDQD